MVGTGEIDQDVAGMYREGGNVEFVIMHVRQGKLIELDLAETDRDRAERQLQAMCEQLLANPVIESYAVSLED